MRRTKTKAHGASKPQEQTTIKETVETTESHTKIVTSEIDIKATASTKDDGNLETANAPEGLSPESNNEAHTTAVVLRRRSIHDTAKPQDHGPDCSSSKTEEQGCASTGDAEETVKDCATEKRKEEKVRGLPDRFASLATVLPQIWAVFALVVLVIAVASYQIGCNTVASPPPSPKPRADDLRSQLESLFPSQAKRFYTTIVAAVRGVQMASPQPTALLLVSNGSSDVQQAVDSMAECLADLLERNLTGKRHAVVVHGARQRDLPPSESKYVIDTQLEAHFSETARVAAVTGIEQLSLEAAKVFYKYCDHENSMHNDVIFVLTVAVRDTVAKSAEQSVERRLLDAWSANPDEVSPILTRVANNVLVLQPDMQFACKLG